jgi:DNA-directed RNA polymerase specialized sigma24 family protein
LDCTSCHQPFIAEQTLIREFYTSDDNALYILEELYRAPLVQFFQSRGVSQVEAEECQIDVFTKVWETKYPRPGNNPRPYDPDLPGAASFRTWVLRIARNCLLDRRRPPLLFSELDVGGAGEEEASVDPTAFQRELNLNPFPQPEAEAIARQHSAAVHDCHEKLPPRPRLAITVWLEHEGIYGIGNILASELKAHFPERGFSAATASNLLNQALSLMQDCLEKKGVDLDWACYPECAGLNS